MTFDGVFLFDSEYFLRLLVVILATLQEMYSTAGRCFLDPVLRVFLRKSLEHGTSSTPKWFRIQVRVLEVMDLLQQGHIFLDESVRIIVIC